MKPLERPGGPVRRGVFFWRGPARLACLVIYVTAFGAATYNHARGIMLEGWFPYAAVPWPVNAYWTSLTVLDPLAIVLLWFKPRLGLWLAIAIMVSDVAVNAGVALVMRGEFWLPALAMQGAFLVFVLATAPWLLRRRSH